MDYNPPFIDHPGAGKAPWPPQLPTDLALNLFTDDELCSKYDISTATLDVLRANPRFKTALAEARKEVEEQGLGFKIRAKYQAEALLDTSFALIHDVDTPAPVKADLIKWTAKMAGHEVRDTSRESVGGGVQININLGGGRSAQVKAVAPQTLEHEDD